MHKNYIVYCVVIDTPKFILNGGEKVFDIRSSLSTSRHEINLGLLHIILHIFYIVMGMLT